METPRRIQRKRTKGWKMPAGAVYVGRPTKWGNPFVVGQPYDAVEEEGSKPIARYICEDPADSVDCFRNWMEQDQSFGVREEVQRELRGKNLVCWCPLNQPCHADVLLELANGDAP